jgi:hypothetical protein
MILNFKTKDKQGRETDFVNKILTGVKIHSIREDKHNRWKVGNNIHFAIGARTKHYRQFHEGTCKGLQKINIIIYPNEQFPLIYVDESPLTHSELLLLRTNDGFDSIYDFMDWFSNGVPTTKLKKKIHFKAKIIHWTTYKY